MMISGLLLAILMVIAVWIIAFYGFSSHNLLILLGLVVAPIGIFLLNNPAIWFVAILGLQQSGLIIPGLPQGLELVHVLMAGFVMVAMAQFVIGNNIRYERTKAYMCLYFFIGVLVLTMAVRGVGLRALGSSMWGGMGYVRILIAAGFLFASQFVILSTRQWKWAIILMLTFSFLPIIAQLIYMLSGGAIYHQYMFIQAYVTGLMESLDALQEGRQAVRFHMLNSVATNLLITVIVFISPKGIKKTILFITIVFIFFLAGLSGFRSALLGLAGSLFFYVLIIDKQRRVKRFVQICFIGLVALVTVIPLAPYMPGSIQRAISWLPFTEVDSFIRLQAESTVDWRIEIWKMAWLEVPEYLLVGKGLTMSPDVMVFYSTRTDSVLGAFVAHNYHSGPLSLLLDFGLLGFISGTIFLIMSSIAAWRNLGAIGEDSFIRRFYCFTLALYIYRVFSFYLIYGDVKTSFPTAFISFAVLCGIARTARSENRDNNKKKEQVDGRKFSLNVPRINPFDQPDF